MADDDWDDSRWGPLTPWLLWGLWPVCFLLFAYGLLCIARQDGVMWGDGLERIELHGADALALGVVYAMLGAIFAPRRSAGGFVTRELLTWWRSSGRSHFWAA